MPSTETVPPMFEIGFGASGSFMAGGVDMAERPAGYGVSPIGRAPGGGIWPGIAPGGGIWPGMAPPGGGISGMPPKGGMLPAGGAFIAGVFPLVKSHGAGAEMRQAMGIAVFSGMIGVTLFGLFLTPVFYTVLMKIPALSSLRGRGGK